MVQETETRGSLADPQQLDYNGTVWIWREARGRATARRESECTLLKSRLGRAI